MRPINPKSNPKQIIQRIQQQVLDLNTQVEYYQLSAVIKEPHLLEWLKLRLIPNQLYFSHQINQFNFNDVLLDLGAYYRINKLSYNLLSQIYQTAEKGNRPLYKVVVKRVPKRQYNIKPCTWNDLIKTFKTNKLTEREQVLSVLITMVAQDKDVKKIFDYNDFEAMVNKLHPQNKLQQNAIENTFNYYMGAYPIEYYDNHEFRDYCKQIGLPIPKAVRHLIKYNRQVATENRPLMLTEIITNIQLSSGK